MTTRQAEPSASNPAQATGRNITALSGALLTGTGVALGAFGAHALKASLSPAMLEVFETGVRYQTYHGLGLLALAAWPRYQGPKYQGRGSRAPTLLLTGTLVFSLSLYLLSVTGLRWLGAVTPLGGLLLLVGWGLVALDAWRGRA